MNKKEIIIELIVQDLRYNQYTAALRKLGIEIYGFELDFVTIIMKLMGIQECPDEWLDLYVSFLGRCEEIDTIPLGKNLYPLAEECYNVLIKMGIDVHTPQSA